MPKIVISYRRSDSDAVAGRIRDRLAAYYGNQSLFMDIDDIPYGTDFREHVRGEMLSSDIVIVVIGPKWLGNGDGSRQRIKDESDPVRIEIETALQNSLRIVPVLVNGAAMPTPADLPDSLRDFAFRNAASVETGRDFHPHMDRLIRSLDRMLGPSKGPLPPDSAPIPAPAASSFRHSPRAKVMLALAAVIVAGLAFSLGAGLLGNRDSQKAAQPPPEQPVPPPKAPTTAKSPASGCSSDMAAPVLDDTKIPAPGTPLRNALTGAITAYFRCSTVPFDTLARTFATISVVIPHHLTDAKCFDGNTRVLVAGWADQKAWADRQGREDQLWVSLHRTIEQAIACLGSDQQGLFFADVARAFAAATTPLDTHTFVNPSLRGRRIDRCLYYARDCNDPAAQAWCQRFGFARAVKWDWEYVFPSYTLGDRLVCPAKGCGGFSAITCSR